MHQNAKSAVFTQCEPSIQSKAWAILDDPKSNPMEMSLEQMQLTPAERTPLWDGHRFKTGQ